MAPPDQICFSPPVACGGWSWMASPGSAGAPGHGHICPRLPGPTFLQESHAVSLGHLGFTTGGLRGLQARGPPPAWPRLSCLLFQEVTGCSSVCALPPAQNVLPVLSAITCVPQDTKYPRRPHPWPRLQPLPVLGACLMLGDPTTWVPMCVPWRAGATACSFCSFL